MNKNFQNLIQIHLHCIISDIGHINNYLSTEFKFFVIKMILKCDNLSN